MTFNIIELENWDRKEYFEHYFNQQTTYSITKEIDITLFKDMIKKKGYEIYPSLIYAIMEVVNKNKVFRTGINSENKLGYWDKLNPLYTVFNKQTEKFTNIWTESDKNFISFIIIIKMTCLNIKIKKKCFLKNRYLKTPYRFQ